MDDLHPQYALISNTSAWTGGKFYHIDQMLWKQDDFMITSPVGYWFQHVFCWRALEHLKLCCYVESLVSSSTCLWLIAPSLSARHRGACTGNETAGSAGLIRTSSHWSVRDYPNSILYELLYEKRFTRLISWQRQEKQEVNTESKKKVLIASFVTMFYGCKGPLRFMSVQISLALCREHETNPLLTSLSYLWTKYTTSWLESKYWNSWSNITPTQVQVV